MLRKFIILLLLSLNYAYANSNVALNSQEGGERLSRSIDNGSAKQFLSETQYLTYQHNLFNCGLTSVAIVLNSLKLPAPSAENLGKYTMFTYNNVLSPEVTNKTGINESTVFNQPGLTLQQIQNILASYDGITSNMYYADEVNQESAHKLISQALKQTNTAVLVNINRPEIGQIGGGHFSPLGAYDTKSDSFLFLDVASHKSYGPTWIKFTDLYKSMNTMDGEHSRGFIIIKYHQN